MGLRQILLFFIVGFASPGRPHEDLLLSLACPSEADCGHHLLDCQPYDGVIRIKGAIHGYKAPEAQAHCHALSRDLCLIDRDPCCSFSNSSDCLQLVPRSDLKLLHGTCGGKGQCLFRSQHVEPGPCPSTQNYSPFSAVAYACVNKSLLLNPTTKEQTMIVGREVHIFYPGRRQLAQRPSVLQEEDDEPPHQGPPSPTPDPAMTLRSALTTLSQLLQAEKFRLNQVFGAQGNDQVLLDILDAMMNEQDEDGEDKGDPEEEGGERSPSTDSVQNNDGRDDVVKNRGGKDTGVGLPEVAQETNTSGVTPWILDRLHDVRPSPTGTSHVAFLKNFGDTLVQHNAFLSSSIQSDVLNDFSTFAKHHEVPETTPSINVDKTTYQPGGNPNAPPDVSDINLGMAIGRSTKNWDERRHRSAVKLNAAVEQFAGNLSAVMNFSAKLDTTRSQNTPKWDVVMGPSKEKMDAIQEQPGEILEADTGHFAKNLDAAAERVAELFNPGGGYRCRVTGSGNGEEEEVAVSMVYLRLVGTRGCTEINVLDGTQQPANFRCTQDKVIKMAGRQLNTMVTPVTTNLRLSSSIWEDDFIWIKFTSVTGGPLILQCQQTTDPTLQRADDQEVNWLVVISGLAVTGCLFLVFAVIAVAYYVHRKRRFTRADKYEMKRRNKEQQQEAVESKDPEGPAQETGSDEVTEQARPTSAIDMSNQSFYAISETFSPAASSSSLSLSPSRAGQTVAESSSLPPLPPLPAGATPRRSVPAMPTRPAPVPNFRRNTPGSSSSSFDSPRLATAAVAMAAASSGPREHHFPPRVDSPSLGCGEERCPRVNAKGWRQVLPPLDIYRNVKNLVTRGSTTSGAVAPGGRRSREEGEISDQRGVPLSRGKGAAWQAADRHSQVQGPTWQTCNNRPSNTDAAMTSSAPSLGSARPSLGLGRFYAAFSAFQQQQLQKRRVATIATTDLDAESEPEAEMKTSPASAYTAAEGEEDGESIGSSAFDFDSFATGDLSDRE